MRQLRDVYTTFRHRLRLLLVMLVLVAVAVPASLIGSGPRPPLLGLGGPANPAGTIQPAHGADFALAAAAKKRQRNADGKHKADKKGKRDKKGKQNKHKADKKGKRQDKKGKQDKRAAADVPANAVAAAAPLTFVPVADAQVNEANPNYNYGTRNRLLVDGGADPDVAGYLRFDLSGVSGTVQQATLRLWVQSNGGTQNGPEVRKTGTSWSESGLTWNTRPQPSGGALDDKGKLPNGTWAEYDVTGAIGGNGAIAFVLLPQTNDGAVFDSREGANKPQLVVTLGSDGSTPTPTPEPNPTPSPTPTPTPGGGASATLLAAGDIASCSSSGDEATAALLDSRPGTIAALGDLAYESGTASEFAQCYHPSWGRHKGRTRPAVGNHEYLTSGASGYFNYFGAAAGDPSKGYYSYNLGAWHIVVLNSNCSKVGGCEAGSAQEKWLRADLAANPTACTLAYWHHPRFSFGAYSNDTRMLALWQVLDDAGAEIVLSGHDHNYQRYAPLDPSGNRDANGIRAFVVGTGGKSLTSLRTPPSTVEASNSSTNGILQLTLKPNGYDWVFVPVAGKTFTDSGSTACH